MPVGIANHRGIGCEKLGDVEQIGGVGEGCNDRDAGVDAEERFVGVVGEGVRPMVLRSLGLVIGHLRCLGGGGG